MVRHPLGLSQEETRACLLLEGMLGWIERHGSIAGLDIDPSCPVRLAWPVADRTIPYESYGRPFRALVPHAELVPLRGVGHVPMYDDPGLVSETILEFTRPQSRAGAPRSPRR